MRPWLIVCALALVGWPAFRAAPARAAEVETWGGEVVSGALSLADGAFHVKNGAEDKKIAVANLFCARFPGQAAAVPANQGLFLFRDGSSLSAPIPLGNCRGTWAIVRNGAKFEFPADHLQALELAPLLPGVQPEAGPDKPHLVMRNGKIMPCELEWLTAIEAGVRNDAGRLRLRLENVHRFVFFPAATVTHPDNAFRVQAYSGDTVFGVIEKFDAKVLRVRNDAGKWEFSPAGLRVIDSCSPRAVSLLSLKPAKVTTVPYVDFVRPPRFGASLTGGAIKIDGLPFATGIAMHSKTELAYDLGGGYSRFVAELGLDTALGNHGDAVAVVRSGNAKLAEFRVNAASRVQHVSVSVKDVKTLVLVVDYGENGSSGDHVIWANPRLVK